MSDEGNPEFSDSSESRPINHNIDTRSDIWYLAEVLSGMTGSSSQRVKAKADIIPKFDPSEKGQTMKKWLHKLDELSSIYAWAPKQTAHFALSCLDGLAMTWYKGLPSVNYSWLEWH